IAQTYRETGSWRNYLRNVHVAGEGEPVRILGAFFGNGVSDITVWAPKFDKLVSTMDRWKIGRTTLEGKRHVSQMMVGGMTQFLTDVQRMPPQVLKRFTKIMQSYLWDDKHNIPVGMEHMYTPFSAG
ncbi:hypothetical protein BC628DRAFT_1283863, partial [Trametes gibbosa]